MTKTFITILAAGKGKRMLSDIPKVLHKLGGQPLLWHVLNVVNLLEPAKKIIVYGSDSKSVKDYFSDEKDIHWVKQNQQLGTGHAVAQAMNVIDDINGVILILYGDVPMLKELTLRKLIDISNKNKVALLTTYIENPEGYGRILREENKVKMIIEEVDAKPEEKDILEVNTGIMALPVSMLRYWLSDIDNNNIKNEYYLTDIIKLANRDGIEIETISTDNEAIGINNRMQLATAERIYQNKMANKLLMGGTTIIDATRLDVRGIINVGKDVIIDVNVILEGVVNLGDRVSIGPFCILKDVDIGNDVKILSHCDINGASIGSNTNIGPFSRIRPNTRILNNVSIGNFVETKATFISNNTKINHLSYIGDAEIGQNVNIGAGTITCNYDGTNKNKTIIGNDTFVGSNSSLIAPLTIGNKATIGAGSSITGKVSDDSLCLTRAIRKDVLNWKR